MTGTSGNPPYEPGSPATRADIAGCYRVFLGRDAESDAVLDEKIGQSKQDIIFGFVGSQEFRDMVLTPLLDGDASSRALALMKFDPSDHLWLINFLGLPLEKQKLPSAAGGFPGLLGAYLRHPAVAEVVDGLFHTATAAELAERAMALAAFAYDRLSRSGVVDPKHYLSQFDHIDAEEIDVVEHYISVGSFEGVDPGPLFDTKWYLSQLDDPAVTRSNALLHYLEVGGFTGLDPNPLFDSDWYLAVTPEAELARVNPLEHYVKSGGRENFPCLLFDAPWYVRSNPGLFSSDLNPLAHFLTSSIDELSDPNQLFSCKWYLENVPAARAAGINPLVHYLQFGVGEGARPNAEFDPSWYLAQHSSVRDAGMEPLSHYLRYGFDAGLDPSPSFSTRWYAERYADELNGMHPLEHFLKVGKIKGSLGRDVSLPYIQQIRRMELRCAAEVPEMIRHINVMTIKPLFVVITPSGVIGSDAQSESISNQIYPNWRVTTASCVSDGIPEMKLDGAAMFIWLDEGDLLSPFALYNFAAALNGDPTLNIIYGDEDALDAAGKRMQPFYKPDWSPDYLESVNYFGSAAAYHIRVAKLALPPATSSYDLALRATELSQKVGHVRHIVLHSPDRFSADAARIESDRAAIKGRFDRTGRAGVISLGEPGKRCYDLKLDAGRLDSVSIVIPTAGKVVDIDGRRIDLIMNCVALIRAERQRYNPEIVIVHNGDLGHDRMAALKKNRCKLVEYKDPVFNVARKLNIGAEAASGKFILLLNDDIEPITPDWIERMMAHFLKPHVGVVGAKLLYTNNEIQHAGVVINGSNADHVSRFARKEDSGYFFSGVAVRNFIAVTGACMLTPAHLYKRIGGYTEALKVSYNDVDYCLKVREAGYTVVFEPAAELFHFESKSRVPSLDPLEYEYLQRRWARELVTDPFYNEERLTLAPPTFEVKLSGRF